MLFNSKVDKIHHLIVNTSSAALFLFKDFGIVLATVCTTPAIAPAVDVYSGLSWRDLHLLHSKNASNDI